VLADKCALVIGGGGDGILRAITRALTAAGSAVAVADVDRKRAEEAAEEAAALGVKAVGLAGDVRTREGVDQIVGRAATELGRLDILVTVVGGQLAFVPASPIREVTDDDWDLMFYVNLRYVVRAVRVALGVLMQAAYGAAKAGLTSLARSVAAEYSQTGCG
jgi:3-oxoacyl-[acyl-carrier protein] reductase